MIMLIVISMLIVMSSHSVVVFCAKPKKDKKENMLAITPQGNTPHPHGPHKSVIVEREDRDSTRTKAGNRNMKSSKEPDSTDDAFKDLAARLAKKEKPDKTNDSLLGDDENPLAQLQMPERPVVEPNQDGAKLENIVEMEKKPKPLNKAPTPQVNPITAKDVSVAIPLASSAPKSKKSQKTKSKLEASPPVHTDKTQSDPRKDVDPTQIGTLEENPEAAVTAVKKEKEVVKKEDSSLKNKNPSMSLKKTKKDATCFQKSTNGGDK
ncbi:hypothetical protein B9Z55_000753 [Caenorhabditis nigoni]|uniref:Uncharacterized protein n=3 Tax=Caenorhabditis nigoni TaxID=1611254 RepID=A0A2G5VUM4_9PELO|nr:hypothetical protein B9Z55_000753 [Caenorhabditis nigoni]